VDQQLQVEREVRICERNHSVDPRSVQKEGRRCSRRRSRGSPAVWEAGHGGAGCPQQPRRPTGEQISKIRSKINLRKKGGVGEGALRFGFISHYPTLI